LPLAEQPGAAAAGAALEPVAAASEEPAMPVSQATTVPSVAEPAPDPVAVLAASGEPATAIELMPTEESMIAMGVAQLDLSAAGTFTSEEPAAAQNQGATAASSESNDENMLCVVCWNEPKTHVLVPCGHRCVCERCSTMTGALCPICRGRVDLAVKVFM
jgi:hypothetical protein